MIMTEKPLDTYIGLGNICRSPMAEAVFTHLVSQRRLPDNLSFRIDSAGTAGYHVGDQPDHRYYHYDCNR